MQTVENLQQRIEEQSAMRPEAYLKERLDEQINWYNAKGKSAQNWFKILRIVEICIAAMIPLLSGFGEKLGLPNWAFWCALAGGLLTIIAGVLSLNRFQELWVGYRAVAEALLREKLLYLTRTPPYDAASPLPLLVQNVEGLMAQENKSWTSYIRTGAGSESGAAGGGKR
jgi:Protein of unknown function (DUF4231)